MESLEIIILAAGNSSRLGQPKQLVVYQGKTLIEHIVSNALQVSPHVTVVLGSHAKRIEWTLNQAQLFPKIVYNADWEQGMGTSIKAGVSSLNNKQAPIMILLSDQPAVKTSLLWQMIHLYQEKNPKIVACDYGGKLGVPMLFSPQVRHELLILSGDQGARSFLSYYRDTTLTVPFALGTWDIDTPEDMAELMRKKN
ncbi:nucleotidyltransferase family protein [Flectobacillus roseus]|uniref:Nucleotidyltransferase family protein n=1 Tax=Flectobacillus roseus TaxID=502259 RepID=A0ABT6Y5K5_9BACT|nr:nucleotidyltransferase family protein [Flectobacillus roseus]MDI9858796.1 nucleotidyltransferase family protein [Flectobacillus roseus]